MIRFLSFLILIPLIVLIAAFSFKNSQLVSIDLFVLQVDLPLVVLILIALFLGVIIGYLYNILALINEKKKIKQLKNKKETLQGFSSFLDKADK